MGIDESNITAIILASGESRRMGKNKLLLDFRDKTIIETVIRTVDKVGFKEVILVCKDHEVEEIGEKYDLTVLLNSNYKYGQSESIKLALKNIKENCDFIFFVGDIPLIKSETLSNMVKLFDEKKGIVVATADGKNKNPVIFQGKYKEDLLKLEGDRGGREIILQNLSKEIVWEGSYGK